MVGVQPAVSPLCHRRGVSKGRMRAELSRASVAPDEVLLVYTRRRDGDQPLVAVVSATEDAIALRRWLSDSPRVAEVSWEEHGVVGVDGSVRDGMEVHLVCAGGPSNTRPHTGAENDPVGLSAFARLVDAERCASELAAGPNGSAGLNRVRTVRVGAMLLDR